MSSRIRIHWREDISLVSLLKVLQKEMKEGGFHLKSLPGIWGCFKLSCRMEEGHFRGLVEEDSMLNLNLRLEEIHRLSWGYCRLEGETWLSFQIGNGELPGDPYDSVSTGRLTQVWCSTEVDLLPNWAASTERLLLAAEQYRFLKALRRILAADVMEAWASNYDMNLYVDDDDPGHKGKLFRFADEGGEVLLRPFEENPLGGWNESSFRDWRILNLS